MVAVRDDFHIKVIDQVTAFDDACVPVRVKPVYTDIPE